MMADPFAGLRDTDEEFEGFVMLDDVRPSGNEARRRCHWPSFDDGEPCQQFRPCPHHNAVTGLPNDGRQRCISNAGCARLAVRGADLCEEHGGEPVVCGMKTRAGGECQWQTAMGPCKAHGRPR